MRILVEDTIAQQIPDHMLILPPKIDGTHSPKSVGSSKRTSMQSPRDHRPPAPPPIRTTTPLLEESVRATLSPIAAGPSPRPSADLSRASSDAFRRSMDLKNFGRRSVDLSRLNMDGAGPRSTSTSRRSSSRNRLEEEKRPSEKHGSSDSYVHSLEEPGSSGALPSASDDTQASASQILKGSDVFLSPTIRRSASASRCRDREFPENNESRSDSPSRNTVNLGHILPRSDNADVTDSADTSNISPAEPSASAPTLQSLVKAGSYPLQRAAGFAGYLNKHSKRMSNLLATESMGYVEKVSGMWKGGKKHYDEPQGIAPDDEMFDDVEDEQTAGSGDRFRDHFALPATEKLQAAYFGFLHRVLPLYGKIYISDRSFCFRSLLPGTRTKLILPLKDIENVDKEKGFRFGYSGLVVVIKGHEELFFEFSQPDIRDDCAVTLLQHLDTVRYLMESGLLTMEERRERRKRQCGAQSSAASTV